MLQAEAAERLLEEALEATRINCPMTTGDIVLECGHELHFHIAPPHKKEILWCRRCQAEKAVAQVGTGKSFRVKCETCKFTRGKDGRLSADRAAVAHRSKRAHHVVKILDHSGTTVHTFQDDVTVTNLPDMAPF